MNGPETLQSTFLSSIKNMWSTDFVSLKMWKVRSGLHIRYSRAIIYVCIVRMYVSIYPSICCYSLLFELNPHWNGEKLDDEKRNIFPLFFIPAGRRSKHQCLLRSGITRFMDNIRRRCTQEHVTSSIILLLLLPPSLIRPNCNYIDEWDINWPLNLKNSQTPK